MGVESGENRPLSAWEEFQADSRRLEAEGESIFTTQGWFRDKWQNPELLEAVLEGSNAAMRAQMERDNQAERERVLGHSEGSTPTPVRQQSEDKAIPHSQGRSSDLPPSLQTSQPPYGQTPYPQEATGRSVGPYLPSHLQTNRSWGDPPGSDGRGGETSVPPSFRTYGGR